MNKKMIAGIAVAGLLLGLAIVNSDGVTPVVLEDDAKRTVADIENEAVTYLDSEAVALANVSDSDKGFRAEALDAFQLVNEERAQAGLGALKWDQNLETVSSVRAKECSQKFSHTRPNGTQWYTVNSKIQGGENLAFGFDTAGDAVDAWMASPTHRDNILYDDFKKVSISIYQTDDGTCYWAQEYGY